MKKYSWIAAIVVAFAMLAQVVAAPLFPDVPANHWARDAVAQLAAKGIVEGYPDGTFKGDRAATRWEMAMVVARMLAKSEQMWATFATKEDLEALKQLVNTLREELDALGVRVTNLEDNLTKLTKRVWDLEKIRFYGSVDSVFVTQGFKFTGGADPGGLGVANAWAANNAVGSANGTLVLAFGPTAQFIPGNPAVIDYLTGTPMVNGTAFTTKGILGTNIRVSDDVAAGVEFAAYSRLGDQVVAPYFGVTAPYLSNIFTSDIANTGMTNRGTPWTKLTLDNAWFVYKPTGVKVVLGSFGDIAMDPVVLYGEPNPNFMNGPRVLPFFGVKVTGTTHFLSPLKYEVLSSKLADGQPGQVANAIYNTMLTGFDLDWEFKGGDIRVNFLRAANDFFGGTRLAPGGAENPFGWINPPGYFARQVAQQIERPVQAGDNANGLIGPQDITIFGGSFRYEFPNNIRVEGSYASSTYRPNTNSGYSVNGQAAAASVAASLFKNLLDLKVEYVGASPYFDPFIMPYPNVIGGLVAWPGGANMSAWGDPFYRFGQFAYIPGYYQLHDSELYPNNRQGFRVFADYKFPGGNGNVYARLQNLTQIGSSRNGGTNGLNTPGYVEPLFPVMAGNENTLGKVENLLLGVNYTFPKSRLKAAASYDFYRWKRPSAINRAANVFNIAHGQGKVGLFYTFNDKVLGKAGYNFASFRGAAGNTFVNIDYTQTCPYVGLDYHISDNTDFALLYQLYSTDDKRNTTRLGTGAPYKWDGQRLFTEIKISF